jgi:hypothetical protein
MRRVRVRPERELRGTRAYLALRRTSGPVTLQVFPLASVPLKLDCAVCADEATLHHRVRMLVEPFAAMRRFGFVAEPAAPSNVSTRRVTVTATPPVSFSTWSYNHVFGRVAQLAISVIGWPLKGTGFGDTVTVTAPVAAPVDGAGDGVGEGVGEGDGLGAGAAVPPLFDREGTPADETGVGDVGSTAPQLIVTSAATSEATRNGVRILRARPRKTRT